MTAYDLGEFNCHDIGDIFVLAGYPCEKDRTVDGKKYTNRNMRTHVKFKGPDHLGKSQDAISSHRYDGSSCEAWPDFSPLSWLPPSFRNRSCMSFAWLAPLWIYIYKSPGLPFDDRSFIPPSQSTTHNAPLCLVLQTRSAVLPVSS